MSRLRRIETLVTELFMAVQDHKRECEAKEKSLARFFKRRDRGKVIDKSENAVKLTLIQGGKPSDDIGE